MDDKVAILYHLLAAQDLDFLITIAEEDQGEDHGVTAALTCGTLLDHFVESDEVFSIVASLPEVCADLRARETSQQRFTGANEQQGSILLFSLSFNYYAVILDAYQAQPHLLDSYLGEEI